MYKRSERRTNAGNETLLGAFHDETKKNPIPGGLGSTFEFFGCHVC